MKLYAMNTSKEIQRIEKIVERNLSAAAGFSPRSGKREAWNLLFKCDPQEDVSPV